MNFGYIKKELYQLKQAFFVYRRGAAYVYWRVFARSALKRMQKMETAIKGNISIHMLTCRRDFVIAVWSLKSIIERSGIVGEVVIHDDGSLTEKNRATLRRLFPQARVVSTLTFISRHGQALVHWPTVRRFRTVYPNFSLRKLVDPYFESTADYLMIVDSDVLFFSRAEELLEIPARGKGAYMQDNGAKTDVTKKSGGSFDGDVSHFNAGIVFFKRNDFSLDRLEQFLGLVDETKSRNLHFLDQIGYPYAVASVCALPHFYALKEKVNDRTVAKHYTSPRRALMYAEGLKKYYEKN